MGIYHTSEENAIPGSRPIEEILGVAAKKYVKTDSQPHCMTLRNCFLYVIGADCNPYTGEPSRAYPEPTAEELETHYAAAISFMRTGGWP